MTVPSVSRRAVSVLTVGWFVSFVHFEVSGAWELAIPDHASRVSSAIASVRKAFMVSSHFLVLLKVNSSAVLPQLNAAAGSSPLEVLRGISRPPDYNAVSLDFNPLARRFDNYFFGNTRDRLEFARSCIQLTPRETTMLTFVRRSDALSQED